jgi:hypothetical protein
MRKFLEGKKEFDGRVDVAVLIRATPKGTVNGRKVQ